MHIPREDTIPPADAEAMGITGMDEGFILTAPLDERRRRIVRGPGHRREDNDSHSAQLIREDCIRLLEHFGVHANTFSLGNFRRHADGLHRVRWILGRAG